MGRGNFCPPGDLADQWYIDYDFYRYDDDEHEEYEVDFDLLQEDISVALERIQKRFPSFHPCDLYMNHYWAKTGLLENKYFIIGTADNQWSEAVFIQLKDEIYPEEIPLADRHFSSYCKEIQRIMLETFGTIYLRAGAWCATEIKLPSVS